MEKSHIKSKTFTVKQKDKLYEITADYKRIPYYLIRKKLLTKFSTEFIRSFFDTRMSTLKGTNRLINIVADTFFDVVSELAINGDVYKSKYLTVNVAEVPVIDYIPQSNFHTNFKTFRVAITENLTHTRYYFVMSKSKREQLRKNLEQGNFYAKYEKLC